MSSAANEVIRAFVATFSADDGHVVLRQRGGSPGYVHVVPSGFDPTQRNDRHLAVELANGTVSVTKELQPNVNAHDRPDVSISDHELGWSVGTNSGRFKWSLSYDEIVNKRGGIKAFAQEIARHYRALTPSKG